MSIKAISWAWQQEAKSSHKFVLLAIADSANDFGEAQLCLLYTSPSPRDLSTSRMPSSA